MTPSIKASTLSRSSTMVSTRSITEIKTSQPPSLALVPVRPAQTGQYSFWTPPKDSGSPVDDPWGFSHDNYSSSTLATSSSDDESASETALTLVPKKVAVNFDSPPKKAITDLVVSNHTVSNLSGFFRPMMAAEQGGMQLLSVRSPSVHYDKVIHGARSPATTVHLVLPRSASGRVGKPPLPLPKSAKDKLRPQAITAASAPVVGASSQQPQPQQQRPALTESVTSPPVIGLDISLMPPTDHRDSAFSPRSSLAVKTPAKSRPNTLMPIDIPKRRSTSTPSGTGPILWKPGSAPPTSPISSSSRPPEPSMPAPMMASTTNNTPRLDTLTRSRIASTSSVSITRPIMASTPSPAPAPASQPLSTPIVNERAEILRRTLSSTNVTTTRASRADATLSVRRAEDSPHSSLSSSHTLIEKALPPAPSPERSPLVSHPPPPAPEQSLAQSTIQFPTDEPEAELELEPEYVETPPLLRVVNVTEQDFVISPTSPPPPEPTVIPPAPTIEVVPSSPQEPHVELAVLAESIARGLTPTGLSVLEVPEPSPKRSTPSPKHASLPVPSRPSSHFHRVSLSDGPVSPPSVRGSFVPSTPSRSSALPPLSRPWLPRRPVMPTPLQPTASLPNVQLSAQPLPVRQSYLSSPQGQPFPTRSSLTVQELPPSQRNSQRNSYRPMAHLAPPNPHFAQPDAYSSDEDDPSKWASIPEESASRRSSRSSRSINRNSIYQSYAVETDDEDAMVYPPPPSISLPNLRSILQAHDIEAPVTRDGSGGKRIQFAVPNDAAEKPSQAAGGKTRRIRRRSNSTDSVVGNSREVPWGTNPTPKKSGLVTIPDPYGVKYADEGRYDAINHPELIPTVSKLCSNCLFCR